MSSILAGLAIGALLGVLTISLQKVRFLNNAV
jgi:hypothetical protein